MLGFCRERREMTVPTIFETCRPRPDVLAGKMVESDFAADLAQVIVGKGPSDYVDPVRFFNNTYPTRGLKSLLANVCKRLSGAGGEVASIFRLDTTYGGGKSHGLIALCHAARHGAEVPSIEEFVDPSLLPRGPVRIAAYDGENADPANGRRMEGGQLAFTPWGEIAFSLAGPEGYERMRGSDERCVAPGADTIRELFEGEPTLILLDELSVYLRKVRGLGKGQDQLTAFLTSLFTAVESSPNAILVYTLAIGKDGHASDAYGDENRFIADRMAELESVSARKATLLNPTEEDETVKVLRRRLFEEVDAAAAAAVVDAYRAKWGAHGDALPAEIGRPEMADVFRASYPLHPEILETFRGKTATLGEFQRVRGMLRLLARTVAHLWAQRPDDATAIHLHHIDPGHEPIQQEIVTRLGQRQYVPAIENDISAGMRGTRALAQEIDAKHNAGLPPYACYAARTAFMHTLAFNNNLKGIGPEQLRYSILGPGMDVGFIEESCKKFCAESAYLDDRPGAPMRFLAEANLNQIIRRAEGNIEAEEVRVELNDRIGRIFDGKEFEAVPFPGGPFDVADEVADGRPKLVVIGYDAVAVGEFVESVPPLIERIYSRKGSEGSALRSLRNNLVFLAAEESRKEHMRRKMYRRLALREMKRPESLGQLAEHQQNQVRELESRSEGVLAVAIQQCYRHLFYPSPHRLGKGDVDLAHSAMDIPDTSDRPGPGQRHLVRALRNLGKLRSPEDEPDSAAYVRDRTPLKKGQITTLSLRHEFRRDPGLPILLGDVVFVRGVRQGIQQGEYVYRRGELLLGPGDPSAQIAIDEQSTVFTMVYARSVDIWPRKPKPSADEPSDDDSDGGGRPLPPVGLGPVVGEGGTTPVADGPVQPAQGRFSTEGVLREALMELWSKVRAKRVEAISMLTIRMFEAGDAFRLLGAVGAVSATGKVVSFEGGYETGDGGSLEVNFRGSVEDARPVREFLEQQLRVAASTRLETRLELTFADGLPMTDDAADKLADKLGRFSSGAAHVSAEIRR